MNIYEFVAVLRRQKWLLAIGGGILILLVAGAWLSIAPKYTATVRMLVAEAGTSDLADVSLASSDFFRIAAIYGDLLSSAEAEEEIATKAGIDIDDLRVTTSDRTSSLELAIDSPTPEGAVAGALGGFTWLTERIRESPQIVFNPVNTTTIPPLVIEPSGRLTVEVELEVEPLYRDADPTVWFEIDTFEGDGFATPLALLEPGMSFESVIYTDAALAVSIGPETESPFDVVQMQIPALPENPLPGIKLDLLMRRGAVLFTNDTPTLNPSAFSLSWENPTTAADGQPKVVVLMLNPDLRAIQVGQRRGPIISGAVLVLGVACLLILATARDGWQRQGDDLPWGSNARIEAKHASRDSA